MPVLAKDVDLWPPDLLSDSDEPTSGDRSWYALHTKPRREKVLLRKLRTAGKSFYGALVPHESRTPRGRLIVSHQPLFPGYIFLRGGETDRFDAVCTNLVANVLEVADSHNLRSDLHQIQRAVESGRKVTRLEGIEQGQSVRIVSGPLSGQSGIFLHKKGRSRIILSLPFIQQHAAVEVEDSVVEPV